ncbi:MAG: hypothetical protein H0W64_02585 [Gammaproteobacteria bacterium]|nr:hypothetical protein [Gammaproteobacteria bacterium]
MTSARDTSTSDPLLYGIFNLSKIEAILKKPIPFNCTSSIRNLEPCKKEIIPASMIDKFLEEISETETSFKVVRFLLKVDNTLLFAKEGYPCGEIPAHFQMANLDIRKAFCLSAGNAFFDDKNTLYKINHQSGDFRPDFNSLGLALSAFKSNRIKLNSTIRINELNKHGCTIKSYQLASNLIDENIIAEANKKNLTPLSTSNNIHSPQSKKDKKGSSLKLSNFWQKAPLEGDGSVKNSTEFEPVITPQLSIVR